MTLTDEVAARLAELTGILHAALDRQAAPLDLTTGKITPAMPALDVGLDATPVPAPGWADYEPRERAPSAECTDGWTDCWPSAARSSSTPSHTIIGPSSSAWQTRRVVTTTSSRPRRAADGHNAAIDRRQEIRALSKRREPLAAH